MLFYSIFNRFDRKDSLSGCLVDIVFFDATLLSLGCQRTQRI